MQPTFRISPEHRHDRLTKTEGILDQELCNRVVVPRPKQMLSFAGGVLLGLLFGIALGHQLVGMYELFFKFPDLAFRLDYQAVAIALGVGLGAVTLGVFYSVRQAARLPPAEAMRPEAPASYRPSWLERLGLKRLLSHSFRISVRNLERRPIQALFTVAGRLAVV